MGRSDFPFRFGRQTRRGPTRIGIGFEVTDVTNWLRRIDFAPAAEGEGKPLAFSFLPIQRRGPFLLIDREPAQGQPEFRTFIAAVFHERHIFPVRDEPRRELKALEKDAVARPFVVESKSFVILVANPIKSFGKTKPAQRDSAKRRRWTEIVCVRRKKWIL